MPAPSIDPAVVPPPLRAEMSKLPPALVMKRAFPPEELSWNVVTAPLFVVIVALPAVLVLKNSTELKKPKLLAKIVVMVALPAVLEPAKRTVPLLKIMALPALLVSMN
ncbi:MAG: hypothetical protein JO230_18900 [Xanthobacteraceae bacterium]|nr:hypothetical protein [Xanthobacteraceae bacterium]